MYGSFFIAKIEKFCNSKTVLRRNDMPYIEVKTSIKLDNHQRDDLGKKLINVVANAFGKPKQYIMTNIEDDKVLYMADNEISKGAYIAISLLGSASRSACQVITAEICQILQNDYDIDGANVYVTYHPVEFWGWNGSMF